MSEIITVELKSDLEHIYKITGDLLNEIEGQDWEQRECGKRKELEDRLRAGLMEVGAVLQKDIFNCDYILSKHQLKQAEQSLPGNH